MVLHRPFEPARLSRNFLIKAFSPRRGTTLANRGSGYGCRQVDAATLTRLIYNPDYGGSDY
jgi:hypothetical protein